MGAAERSENRAEDKFHALLRLHRSICGIVKTPMRKRLAVDSGGRREETEGLLRGQQLDWETRLTSN